MAIYSIGLNCYMTKRHRLMIDGGMADVNNSSNGNGSVFIIQTRLQLEF